MVVAGSKKMHLLTRPQMHAYMSAHSHTYYECGDKVTSAICIAPTWYSVSGILMGLQLA